MRLQLRWVSLQPRSKVCIDVVQYMAPLKRACVRTVRFGRSFGLTGSRRHSHGEWDRWQFWWPDRVVRKSDRTANDQICPHIYAGRQYPTTSQDKPELSLSVLTQGSTDQSDFEVRYMSETKRASPACQRSTPVGTIARGSMKGQNLHTSKDK